MPSHTEKSCQLCSIPFNIGRVRTVHEPLEAGWDPTGLPYHLRDATNSRCSRSAADSGCKNVVVKAPPNVHAESRYQHLAGPGCTFEGGYNGWRIGEREMRGVGRARYVLRKARGCEVEEEDEGDEGEESEFFVSDEMDDTPLKCGTSKLSQERYGVHEFIAQNYPKSGYRGEDDVAIPVHSACWKIFERVSIKKLGHVDLDGFVALWWRQACGGCGFQELNQDPLINDLKEKYWAHRPGTEYLAANPVEIPGFKLMMQGVYAETPKGDGAFVTKDSSGSLSKSKAQNGKMFRRRQNPTDPFKTLPTELKNKVLEKLSPKDLSNLRLSSRSFRQLPKQIFKSFIAEEMPWFWEIDDVRADVEEYYHSSFTEQYGDALDLDLDMLEGVLPPAWFTFLKERVERKPMDINWYEVYKQLKVLERASLGLRNRKRIWRVVEEVVGKIEGARKSLGEKGGEFVVYPEEMRGKGGDEKDHSCCPRCMNVQIELEEDIFEEDSVDGDQAESSEEDESEDVSSSGEDSE